MSALIRLLGVAFLLVTAFQSHAESKDFCELYPITLPNSLVEASQENSDFQQVPLGNGHGNYSWLSWTGKNDTNTLANSLIPPGDSDTYVHPYDTSDELIEESDWVQGAPGVKNGKQVRDNLDALIGQDIIIPLWSQNQNQGSNFDYQVHRFGIIEITDYRLNGKGWLSFVYKGYTNCYNEPPVAEDRGYQTPEDTSIELTAVATDVDGDSLTYTVVQPTQFGTLSGTGPSYTYTPNKNFNGQDSFTFKANDGEEDSNLATVTITVTPVNDPPVADAQTLELDEDTSVQISLTGMDIDDDAISFNVNTQPVSGQLTGSAPNLIYTPNINFNGEDSFTFVTNDGQLNSQPATVKLIVKPVNDAPEAHDGTAETKESEAVSFTLQATDIDGDALTYSLVSAPQHGTAELNGADITYVPEASFFGDDQLTFKVNDGALDSNIATVDIVVLEKNKAPTIVSSPILSALEGFPYSYDVDAEDPNTWDVLSYAFNTAPPQASIEAESGKIQWTPSDSYAGNNALDNPYCALSKELDINTSPVSDVTVVIDESGSMSGEHDWVAELIPLLEAHLRSNEIGDGAELNNYGLVGYGNSNVVPRQINVGSSAMGTAEEFIAASKSLRTSGGTEDGWAGLKFALGYPLRDGSSRNMILVTDEDRDNTDDTLTFESIKADLETENVILNVAVNAKFECEDGTAALGLGQNKVGYVANGSGGFEICQNARVKSDSGTTDKDYIDLALSLGGAAWDLNVLRSGGINAQSFSSAFVEIKVQEIKRQFEAVPQADIAVINAQYFDKTVTATIKNRSALSIDSPIQVNIFDGTEIITNLTISNLASGEEKTLTYSLANELKSELKVIATIQDTTVNECSVENNTLKAVKFDTQVTDTGGLTDNQVFAISVQDTNDAPVITSTPSTSASVDVFYNYKVTASDSDIGDGLIYSLSQSPVGMTIDELSGTVDFKPNSSQSGQHEVIVNVTDLSGAQDSQTYTLVVDGSYIAPKFVSQPIVRAIQGTEYSYQTQTQKDDTATLSYRLFRGPEGISFSQDTGLLTWSVPENIKGQKFPVILQVQDQLGNYDIQAFDLIGDIPPVAPRLSKQNLPTANLDANYGRTFSASDSNAVDSLSWEMLKGPENSSIDSSNGIFRWTPATTSYPGSRADFDPYCVASDSPLNNLELNTKWVSGNKYINQPLVAPMYDSNQDGLLNNDDRKVIIGITTSRYVVALDALTGKELWRRKDVNANRYNIGAIVNLDNDTNAEFVFVQESSRKLVALNSDGSTRWVSQDEVADVSYSRYHYNAVYPTDLDGDGGVELLFGPSVFSSEGERLWHFSMPSETYTYAARGNSLAVDIDADGSKEIFYYDEVRDSTGNLLWKIPSGTSRTVRISYFAYGNFDSDAEPEIVVNEYNTRGYWLKLIDNDGSLIWEKRIPRVGVLNLADFDNDSELEIYSASSDALYDSDGTEVWSNGSSTSYFGASIADIDADGYLDILRYRTDNNFYIYQGSNGLLSRKIKTGYANQGRQGSPLFIDIDNDGQGEIITSGAQVQVFESNNNSWLSASPSYNHLQQSLGGFAANGKPTSTLLPYYGQTAEKAPNELESGRKHDLAITHAEVYPSGARYRVEVSLTNRGTANYEAGGVIRLYANTVDESNKIVDITIPELAINKRFTGYHYIDDHQTWREQLIAKVIDNAGSECSAQNSIASAETVRISVTDSDNLSDELSWAIAVQEREQVPTFTTSPATTAVVGSLYSYTAQATDTNRGDKVRYFLGNSPSGVTLNSVTGEVQWTPKEHQAGRHNIQIKAIDLSGRQRTQSYIVTVNSGTSNNAPVITSDAVTVASVGYSYYYNMTAEDLDADILSYSLESAPAGMTINSLSGELYWTPTESDIGSIEVIGKVTDESGASDTQTFNLTVRTNAPPVINSTPEQTVVSGSTYVYDVNASDADGDDITYELITAPAGMNIDQATGVVQWSTVNVIRDEYAVKVRASDTFGSYSEQSFGLTVTEQSGSNNPPSITSTPSGNAVFDTLYSYDVNATDTDGDSLSYLLELSPSGMSINPSSGLIEWTPTSAQDGSHDVIVRVEDGRGGYATQSYAVYVSDGSTSNALPVITSSPGTTAKATFEYSYQIIATDADGDTLEYSLTDYPQGMTLTPDGLLEWTPESEQVAPVKVRVSDGKGYVEQGWTLNVVSADTALSAEITPTPKYVDDGESVLIQVTPVNAVDPITVTLKVDGNEVPVNNSYQAEVIATGIGTHALEAIVSDKYETVTVTSSFIVKDPNDIDEPSLAIHSPIAASTVSAPTDVVISVNDSSLAHWRLVYTEKGSAPDEFVTLAEGTENISEQPVATFDPTMLQNGQYAIVLEATDSNGFTSQENVFVAVEGDLKVGNFSITFEDVNIPVAGIPITVTRTYDTRQKHKDLDFGQGWSVGYQNVRVHESRTVGLGWSLNEYSSGLFSNWCVEPNGDPVVSVTLPNGRIEKFVAKASPHCQQIVPQTDVNIVFEPMAGTTSKISQSSFGLVRLYNGNIVDLGEPDKPIDPDHYKLTTADGFVYSLDQNFGVRNVSEPSGHSLTFTKDGVVHSGGKGISFVRDIDGNITAIDLPDGTQIKYEYDANGDLVAHRDQLNNKTEFTYNNSHGLLDIIDPRGVRVTRNEYDDSGRLIAQIDPDGNRIEFTHDIDSRLEVIKDRRGNTQVFTYDDMGNVLSEQNGAGETITRTYDEHQNVLSKTDDLGNTVSWTYDDRRNQLTETDALGNVTEYTYSSLNKPLTEKGPDGNILVTNTYKTNGQLTSSTNAVGDKTDFAYATAGLSSISDSLGATASYAYSGDNIASETNANGVSTSYTYDSMGRKLTESVTRTNAEGVEETLTTSYEYDDKGRITKSTAPDGSITKTEYNVFDKETATIDELGRRTEYEYDNRGNLVKTTYPDGSTETQVFDEENNLVSQTDRAGRTTTMVYDGANRLTKTIYPDLSETRIEYDRAGRVIANIDQRGNRTEYVLDKAGRQIEVKDALGNVTKYEYDKRGNRIKMIDANNHTYTYVYDLANRLTETIYPDGTKTTITYDARGRKVSENDQAGNTTQFEYDGNGNLIKVIDALNHQTTYGYDELNNKISQTDAELRTTQWAYNQSSQVVSRTLPMGQVESFEYDESGNRIKHVDFNGQVTSIIYDQLGRETRRDYLTTGDFVETAYTTSGQVASVTDKHGVTAYDYDTQDRLIKVTYPNGQTIEYAYDVAGNRTQVKTQHNIVDYSFDELNRLESVIDGQDITTYGYDNVGNRASISYANGTSIEYSYNDLNRLTQVVHKDSSDTITQQFDYTLGLAGNRTKLTELSGRVVDYTYDDLYRLTSEVVTDSVNGNRSTSFTYDKVGNRLTQVENGVTTTYQYNNNDQIIEENDGTVITRYTYDANGNTTQKVEGSVATDYVYSQDNRLIKATTGNDVIGYTYDASGIRQSKSNNGVTTQYLVDQNRDYAQVIAELNGAGQLNTSYVYGDDLISQSQSSGEHYFMYDGLGSTRSLTDSSGLKTDSYIYKAFGEVEHKDGVTPNNYLFTGEQYDPNLGFYYLRARYYNQNNGRFFSLDTYQGSPFDPEKLHKYLYTKSNPIMYVDPSGNVFGGFAFGGFPSLTISTVLRTSGSGIASVAGRNAVTRILFGRPPKDFGIIGELVLDNALGAVFDALTEIHVNKTTFGTAAHLNLENRIKSYKPLPDVEIETEVFVLEPDDDGTVNRAKRRREKGSIGIDLLVKYKGKPVLGLDLKTGRGASKKRVGALKRRLGVDIVEIKVDFSP